MSFYTALKNLNECFDKVNKNLHDNQKTKTDEENTEKIYTLITQYMEFAKDKINTLTQTLEKEKQKKQITLDNYNDSLVTIKNDFIKSLNQITDIKKFNISNIKSHLEETNNRYDNMIKDNLVSIEANNSKTNQIIFSHLIKHNQEFAKNDFQIADADKNYNAIINQFNVLASAKKSVIRATASRQSYNYDDASKNIIDNIDEMISSKNKEIVDLTYKLNKRLETIHQEIIGQSTKLNEKINLISLQGQKEVSNCKIQLDIENNQINVNISHVKDDILEKNKQVLQEFAEVLTKLDEEFDVITRKYNLEKDSVIRNFHYLNFELEKKVNSIKEEYSKKIDFSTLKNDQVLMKKQNQQRNALLKEQLQAINELKRRHSKELADLENNYTIKSGLIKKQKYIAEIEKNYKIKQLTLEENASLNELQRQIERTEYQTQTLINIINNQYNIKINELRLRSDIKVLGLKKEITKIDETIKHTIDELQTQINNLESEKKFNQKLHSLSSDKEKRLNTGRIKLIEVLTLLHVENNKILQTYNKKCHFINSKMYDTKYNYLEKESFINRDFFKNKILLENETISHDKQSAIKLAALEIKDEETDENFMRSKKKLSYIKDIGLEKYYFYTKRLRFEKVTVFKSFNIFSDLLKSVDNILIQLINENISCTLNPQRYIEIIKMISTHKNDLADAFLAFINQIIQERINFETGFKYNSLLADIDEQFDSRKKKLEYKAASLNDTISNYQNTLHTFIKKKINIENELLILNKEFSAKKITNEKYKKDKKEINIQIADIDLKIERNEKLISLLNQDLSKVPPQILKTEKYYRNKKFLVSKRLKKESHVYFSTISSVEKQTTKLTKFNEKIDYLLSNKYVSIINKEKNLACLKKLVDKFYLSYLSKYKTILNKSSKKITDEHLKIKRNYLRNEIKDRHRLYYSHKDERNQIIKDKKAELGIKQNNQSNYQKQSRILLHEKKTAILTNKKSYDFFTNDIMSLKIEYSSEFYNNCHSMLDNINFIKKENKQRVNLINSEYNNSFKILLKNTKFEKNADMSRYLTNTKRFKQTIDELPSVLKIQANELSVNTRIEKKNILNNIKSLRIKEKHYLKNYEKQKIVQKDRLAIDKFENDKQRRIDISSIKRYRNK